MSRCFFYFSLFVLFFHILIHISIQSMFGLGWLFFRFLARPMGRFALRRGTHLSDWENVREAQYLEFKSAKKLLSPPSKNVQPLLPKLKPRTEWNLVPGHYCEHHRSRRSLLSSAPEAGRKSKGKKSGGRQAVSKSSQIACHVSLHGITEGGNSHLRTE